MRQRHHHNAFVAYADVLMCVLAFMTMLVALLLTSFHIQATANKDYHPKAEFLVSLTWDNARDVDLDLWVQSPDGGMVFYRNREESNVSLDRDSQGFATNRTKLPDGTYIDSGNKEIVSIRAIVPGNYFAAVSYYAGSDTGDGRLYSESPPDPRAGIDCIVEVEKVNPVLALVASKKVHMARVKQTMNVLAFNVDRDGAFRAIPLPPDNIIDRYQKVGG